jgi:hypothetical protein
VVPARLDLELLARALAITKAWINARPCSRASR